MLYYLAMGYGAYVCVQAYRATHKKAWMLILVFCLSPFLPFVIHNSLKQADNSQKTKSNISDSRGHGIKTQTRHLSFPIIPILLVAGLSFLAEDDIKRKKLPAEEPVDS